MKYILFALSLFIVVACNKSNDTEGDNFINQLENCTYEEWYLPDLALTEISSLLKYRNDKTILCKYPANPISSFYSKDVTLGMLALWTIESIRISELNNTKDPQGRFPSLNPIIVNKENDTKDQKVLQDSAADSYQAWWSSNKSEEEKININPLLDSNLVWR